LAQLKSILSAFFNLHLRRGQQTVTIENPALLDQLAPVFGAAEALGFTEPIIRGGALRDGLQGKEINDYDLYVSCRQVREGLDLPSIKAPQAPTFYANWLSQRLGMSGLQGHQPRITERPYLSFKVRFEGIDHPVDLVINDENLSPEMLALEADATMNGVAASRQRIVAHPLFLPDMQRNIFRPTCAIVGNLISAPARYFFKFSSRDPHLRFRPF
jgi:hypothetical protein